MAKELKITIDIDDRFARASLERLKRLRVDAAASVRRQKAQLDSNLIEHEKAVAAISVPSVSPGDQEAKAKKKKKKKAKKKEPEEDEEEEEEEEDKKPSPPSYFSTRAGLASRKKKRFVGTLKGAGVSARSAGKAMIPAPIAGVARAATPLAAAFAAFKLAEAATNGLAMLSGALGATSTGANNFAQDAEFIAGFTDLPGQVTSAAGRATSLAFSFSKAKIPLKMDALKGIAEFAFQEQKWKKQRERREYNQFGEALSDIVGFMTGFGGG